MKSLLYLMLFWGGVSIENDTIKVTVEDSFAVEADSYIMQLNFFTDEEMMKEMELFAGKNTLSKEDALERISLIKDIVHLDSYDSGLPEEFINIFDFIFIEVKGMDAYRALTKLAKENNLQIVEKEMTLDKLPDYEKVLKERLINLSKQKAEIIATKKNKKLSKIIEFKEVNRFGKVDKKEEEKVDDKLGFGILKEKFIEGNYKGYLINSEGLILIHKKVEVTWRVR